MRTPMKWWALGIVATLSIALPATAAAAPIDTASDHAALSAYSTYLQQYVAQLPASRSAENAFIASVSQACPNVLAAVNLLPQSAVNRDALVAFAEELGGDVGVNAVRPARAPLARLAATLSRLGWSSSQTGRTVQAFLTAQGQFFRLRPSHLCADAESLAASNAQRTPKGTLRWLARFGRLASAAQTRAAAFGKVLEQFAAPYDAASIAANNRLARKIAAAFSPLVTSEVTKLASALGLSA